MAEGDVTLKLTLVGGNEHSIGMPLAEAQEHQRVFVEAFENETPTGSTTFGNGLLVRHAAIASSELITYQSPIPATVSSPARGQRVPPRAGGRIRGSRDW